MVVFRTQTQSTRRSGFTIIELMIVIIIIAILASLIIPAVGNAIKRTRITGVKNEIAQLDTAIAKFKTDHGIEPPSFIILHEAGPDWAVDPGSTALIRTMWPQFNFSLGRDLNGNGTIDTGTTGAIPVTGSECLVLFLGGVFNKTTSSGTTVFSMHGFSKDPTDPFAKVVAGNTREAPLFEFNTGRLTDVDNDGIPEYKDSLPSQKNPYLYYSSYDGQGYGNNVITYNSHKYGEFLPGYGVTYGLYISYVQDASGAPASWNTNGHQIISPGYDGASQLGQGYGCGGAYIPSGSDPLPLLSSPPAGLSQTQYAKLRDQEADNITNFASAELRP